MERPTKCQWVKYNDWTDIIEPREAPITDEDYVDEIFRNVVSERQVIGWGEYTRLLTVVFPSRYVIDYLYYLAD